MILDPLPSMEKVFSFVLGQEKQLTPSTSITETPPLVSQVQYNSGGIRGFHKSFSRGRGRHKNHTGRG